MKIKLFNYCQCSQEHQMLSTQANHALPLFPLLNFIVIPLFRRLKIGPGGADEQEINWWSPLQKDCQLILSKLTVFDVTQVINWSSKRFSIVGQYYPTVFVCTFFSFTTFSFCFMPISFDFHLDIIVGLSGVEFTLTFKFLFMFWWNRNKDPGGSFSPSFITFKSFLCSKMLFDYCDQCSWVTNWLLH